MTLWRADEPLVLASKSAVRRAVLEAAGMPVEIDAADIDERGIEARSGLADPGEVGEAAGAREGAGGLDRRSPAASCSAPTRRWRSASGGFPRRPDRAGAREQLRALRGNTHALHSAVAVLRGGERAL